MERNENTTEVACHMQCNGETLATELLLAEVVEIEDDPFVCKKS